MLKDIKHPHLKKEKVNFVFAMRTVLTAPNVHLFQIVENKLYNIPLF